MLAEGARAVVVQRAASALHPPTDVVPAGRYARGCICPAAASKEKQRWCGSRRPRAARVIRAGDQPRRERGGVSDDCGPSLRVPPTTLYLREVSSLSGAPTSRTVGRYSIMREI